jgi:hypothetical protein
MADDPKPPVQVPPNPEPPKPPAEPPADPPKPPAPPAVPDKYELKFADSTPLDPKGDLDRIASYAKANGLTNEQAQKHLDHVQEIATGLQARQQQAFTDMVNAWETETLADKELGGENRVKTEANIKRVMDRFGTEGFTKFVEENGLGNHPDVVRFLNAIGKAMSEDKPLNSFIGRGRGIEPPQPLARRMYPNEPN